jgi:hypothetical protein
MLRLAIISGFFIMTCFSRAEAQPTLAHIEPGDRVRISGAGLTGEFEIAHIGTEVLRLLTSGDRSELSVSRSSLDELEVWRAGVSGGRRVLGGLVGFLGGAFLGSNMAYEAGAGLDNIGKQMRGALVGGLLGGGIVVASLPRGRWDRVSVSPTVSAPVGGEHGLTLLVAYRP